jgi:ABC-type transporter lipoprotein component MlaA
MFGFNEGLDKVIIKPVATGYEAVLPSPICRPVCRTSSPTSPT